MAEKQKIQFKPLHEGMGFHPFSDGLPYAPESKTKSTHAGTGAVSAGRPQFATQSFNTSKPMGTARQMQQQAQPVAQSMGQPLVQPYVQPQKQTQMQRAKTTTNTRPATVTSHAPSDDIIRRRAFAYLMDTVIHAGFWLATNLAALYFFKFQIDSEILKDNFVHFGVFFLLSQWMFVSLQEVLFENSLGKLFFNLEFKRNHGSLMLRSILFMGGLLFFGMGLYFRPQDRLGELQIKSSNKDS